MAKSAKDDDIKTCGCGCGIQGDHDQRAKWLRLDQRCPGGEGFSLAVFGKLRFASLECFHLWAFESRRLQSKFLHMSETDQSERRAILRELRRIGWQYHPPKDR